jgi:2-keto-4-pentenoate hydratase/2-oxohepta-3-ene-1,7-dioic acid hydratase in catechol pathway
VCKVSALNSGKKKQGEVVVHYATLKDPDNGERTWPVGKVVCVGRNYAEHAKELNNPVPAEPLWFIKPGSSIVPMRDTISIPLNRGSCHHELEVAILIGERLCDAGQSTARNAIAGIGLALDLTLRDVQAKLKEKGHPWEIAKAFDGSCVLSEFVPPATFSDLQAIEFSLQVNGVTRQHGSTAQQLFPVPSLLSIASTHFTLEPGDVLLTGTPAGVAALNLGDVLKASLGDAVACEIRVAGR